MLYDPGFAAPVVAGPAFAPPLGGYVAPPFGAPIVAPAPLPVFDASSTVSGTLREEEDYTFWRNSKAKIPILLLILGLFVALILLTMWQARSDIRFLREGVPRDLEEFSRATAKEAGVKKYRRNIRFAVTTISLVFVLLTIGVFLSPLKPVARSKINFLFALIFFLTGILSCVVFALDVNSERDAKRCQTNPHYTTVRDICENREDIQSAITVFDAFLTAFLFITAYCVFAFSRSGDWTKAHDPKLISFAAGPGDLQPGMYPNGVSYVRKWITSLALAGVFAFAVLTLVFTIIIHDDRFRYELRDSFNRPVDSLGDLTLPGWPKRNTELRYALCSLVIITVLINLIPLTSRVIAYVFGVLYFAYAVLAFVTFAVDIDAIDDAKKLVCPTGYKCTYHPYNACAALDFIGAILLLIFIAVEYFVSRRKKAAAPVTVTY